MATGKLIRDLNTPSDIGGMQTLAEPITGTATGYKVNYANTLDSPDNISTPTTKAVTDVTDIKADDDAVVHLAGVEDITGSKTFSATATRIDGEVTLTGGGAATSLKCVSQNMTISDQDATTIFGYETATNNWQAVKVGITGWLTRLDIYIHTQEVVPNTIHIYKGVGISGRQVASKTVSGLLPGENQINFDSNAPFFATGEIFTFHITNNDPNTLIIDIGKSYYTEETPSSVGEGLNLVFKTWMTSSAPCLTVDPILGGVSLPQVLPSRLLALDENSKIISAAAIPDGTTATTGAYGDTSEDVSTNEFATRAAQAAAYEASNVWVSGGSLSIAEGAASFNVSGGTYRFITYDDEGNPVIGESVTFDAHDGITSLYPSLTAVGVYIQPDGTIYQDNTGATNLPLIYGNKIKLGTLIHQGGYIIRTVNDKFPICSRYDLILNEFVSLTTPLNLGANVISAYNGTDLSITKSSGLIWDQGVNIQTDRTNPSKYSFPRIDQPTLVPIWRDNTGTLQPNTPSIYIDNTYYNPGGNSATLVAITSGYWVNIPIIYNSSAGLWVMQYPTEEYSTKDAALNKVGQFVRFGSSNQLGLFVVLGYITVQQGATTFADAVFGSGEYFNYGVGGASGSTAGGGGSSEVDQEQIYYFASAGNDLASGITWNQAVDSPAVGLSKAAAMTPTASNRFSIVCLDAGESVGVTIPAYVNLYAPNWKFTSECALKDNAILVCDKIDGGGSANIALHFTGGSGAGGSIVKCNSITNGSTVAESSQGENTIYANVLSNAGVYGVVLTAANSRVNVIAGKLVGTAVASGTNSIVDLSGVADATLGAWSTSAGGAVYNPISRYVDNRNNGKTSVLDETDAQFVGGSGIYASVKTMGGIASLLNIYSRKNIASLGNVIAANQSVALSATLITLTVTSPQGLIITSSGYSGDQNVNLPDATTLPTKGVRYFIYNESSYNVKVYASDGTTLVKTIPTLSFGIIECTDITTANGQWVYAVSALDGSVYAKLAGSNTFTGTNVFNSDISVNGVNIGNAGDINSVRCGQSALASNTGVANAAFGVTALTANTSGNVNTACGSGSLIDSISGSHNTALGNYSGEYLVNGSYNIYVGSKAVASASNVSNEIAIGYNITGSGSNSTTIGNSSTESVFLRGTVVSGKWGSGAVIGGATMTLGSDAPYDVYYRNSSGILTRLAPNTSNTKQYLAMTGTGSSGAAPVWDTPSASGITGSGTSGQTAEFNGSSSVTSVANATAATASTYMKRDSNANTWANNFINNFATTAMASGTTTLTVASAKTQAFTGTSGYQIVKLPDTSTLTTGFEFLIINASSTAGVYVKIQDSSSTDLIGLNAGESVRLFCSSTASQSWLTSKTVSIPLSSAGKVTYSSSSTISATNLYSGMIYASNSITLTMPTASNMIAYLNQYVFGGINPPVNFGWYQTIFFNSTGIIVSLNSNTGVTLEGSVDGYSSSNKLTYLLRCLVTSSSAYTVQSVYAI